MKMKFWTMANLITTVRVILIPFVLYCFQQGSDLKSWEWWLGSLLLLTICEITDLMDGYLARSMSQVSEFGKLLDPLCDSLLRFSVILYLGQLQIIPLWTVYVFFYRDLTVAYLRILAMSKGVVFAAHFSGKLKAIVQAVGIFIVVGLKFFAALNMDVLFGLITEELLILCTMIIVCAVTAWSGLDYAIKIFDLVYKSESK